MLVLTYVNQWDHITGEFWPIMGSEWDLSAKPSDSQGEERKFLEHYGTTKGSIIEGGGDFVASFV